MRRISAYFINILLILCGNLIQVRSQDTIIFPLKIKAGLEVTGPVTYFVENKNLSEEGYISVDLNEKMSAVLGGGYLNYTYSQYNYKYLNSGLFIRSGVDFNLLKPDKSKGKHWAGIGLRYGVSRFRSEVPLFNRDNYWGNVSSSVAPRASWGHFLEVAPGVRTDVFGIFSIGWTISLRMLLYTGTGKDLRPISFPGFGNGDKTISTGINYFIALNIPYRRIRVIIKKEPPPETGEETTQPK